MLVEEGRWKGARVEGGGLSGTLHVPVEFDSIIVVCCTQRKKVLRQRACKRQVSRGSPCGPHESHAWGDASESAFARDPRWTRVEFRRLKVWGGKRGYLGSFWSLVAKYLQFDLPMRRVECHGHCCTFVAPQSPPTFTSVGVPPLTSTISAHD